MIHTEIFIENKRLDITEDISTLLTFAIDDVKDFASRNTSFSKTIVLPGTSNNNKLLGDIFDARVANEYDSTVDNVETNFNASVGADCLIFSDHIQIFKGTFRILEIIIDKGVPEYECAVFGELTGLVGALGNNKLEDLDFSAYDSIWNAANVIASWDAAPGTGINYPLIDYGGVSVAKVDYDIRAFRPALFVREYIDKMLTDASYSWSCDLFNTARFKSLVIPNNQKSLQVLTSKMIDSVDSSTQVIIQNGVIQEAPIPHANRTLVNFTYAAGVYTYTGVDTITLRLAVGIVGDYYSTIENVQIGIKRNGSQIYTHVPFLVFTGGTTPVTFNETFPDVFTSVNTGDTIEVFAKVANNVGSYRLRTTFTYLTAYLGVPIYADAPVGSTLVINDILPKNILQKDFLTSILKLFNLYVYEDRFSVRKLFIKPYVDFYDLNVSGIVDWNYKLDRGRPYRLKPMSELNSRYYEFKFKPDADYYNESYRKRYNEGYGDYLYDSAFEFVNEKNTLELIFSASVLVGYLGTDKVAAALYKKVSGIEEATDTNIRILQTKKILAVTSWSLKDGVSVLQAGNTAYGYGGHYDDPDAPADDIQFGVPRELFFTLAAGAINVTQFNVYWSSYMAEITDKNSKMLTGYFKLTNKDIFDLDFSKLIYLDGSYWRLNKITDWNASTPDVCMAELLKVIYLYY